jgi:hypothetical protein
VSYLVEEQRRGAVDVHRCKDEDTARRQMRDIAEQRWRRYDSLLLVAVSKTGRRVVDVHRFGDPLPRLPRQAEVAQPPRPPRDHAQTSRLAALYLEDVLRLKSRGQPQYWTVAAEDHSERTRAAGVHAFCDEMQRHQPRGQGAETARSTWLRDNETRMCELAIARLRGL